MVANKVCNRGGRWWWTVWQREGESLGHVESDLCSGFVVNVFSDVKVKPRTGEVVFEFVGVWVRAPKSAR